MNPVISIVLLFTRHSLKSNDGDGWVDHFFTFVYESVGDYHIQENGCFRRLKPGYMALIGMISETS